ncbi:HicA-like toxin [Gordonia phage VanLee]|uniref:HicA-like toxin n=1 Tax=Gordonia phage VanLee TaxID=2845816 RepID=A0A8F2DA85_9CAUD|nr:HicA-like toxin [Gordonia phage VanLee]QWS68240.1 HicA-like toxin [Gordonia phage VanLee]
MSSQSDVRELIKRAERNGWVCQGLTRNSHYRLRFPPTGDLVIVASTPSNRRGLRNAEALMKRISGRVAAAPPPAPTRRADNGRTRVVPSRRRRAARPEPLAPARTTMEVAFDDYRTHTSTPPAKTTQERDVG